MNRYAITPRQDYSRLSAERTLLRQHWSRRSGRDLPIAGRRESQVVRGLVYGLPLAMALWAILALIVWRAF
jgi:hypothetical protein